MWAPHFSASPGSEQGSPLRELGWVPCYATNKQRRWVCYPPPHVPICKMGALAIQALLGPRARGWGSVRVQWMDHVWPQLPAPNWPPAPGKCKLLESCLEANDLHPLKDSESSCGSRAPPALWHLLETGGFRAAARDSPLTPLPHSGVLAKIPEWGAGRSLYHTLCCRWGN